VAFVIRVLQATDDRRRGADESGKLSLGEAGRGPQLQDLKGDILVGARLCKFLEPAWPPCVEQPVKDLHLRIFALADQRFHAKAITVFISKRSAFSDESDHYFHAKPIT
jgi:hypothetical protein